MMSTSSSPIGFIGLGNMGAHMARNLIKNGHKVVVFDLNKDAVAALKQAGAHVRSPIHTIIDSNKQVLE